MGCEGSDLALNGYRRSHRISSFKVIIAQSCRWLGRAGFAMLGQRCWSNGGAIGGNAERSWQDQRICDRHHSGFHRVEGWPATTPTEVSAVQSRLPGLSEWFFRIRTRWITAYRNQLRENEWNFKPLRQVDDRFYGRWFAPPARERVWQPSAVACNR